MREVFLPLTADVVRNNNILDPSTDVIREGRRDSIIDVDIPEHGS